VQDWQLRPARDLGLPPTERLASLRRENGLVSTALHLAWWTAVRGYLTAWHGLTIHGREHLPVGAPFLLVANHTSHLDVLALATLLPWRERDRTFPIAAGDVFFKTPLASAFAAGLLNALPMWRKKCGSHALHDLRQRLLEEPCGYILFPEGTRSRDGHMAAFKPGVGMLVAGTSVPVFPCRLDGCHRALPPEARWPRPTRIHLRIGPPLTFATIPDDRAGWAHVAATLEARVRSLDPDAGGGPA
jgi:1-acyl-sn-glycerol-3-phosphate acyltransferase